MSKIEVNEIAVRSGTNITVSSPIQGEGTAGTTLNQGLAKAWIAHDGTSTGAARDSFNNSSFTDMSTGLYKYNFTNNFSAAKSYTNNGCMSHSSDQLTYIKQINPHNSNDILTSSVEVGAMYIGTSNPNHDFGVYDYDYVNHSAHGDLA